MLDNLPESATVYSKNKNELEAVGATNNLRGLAANIKFISENVPQVKPVVKQKNADLDPTAEATRAALEKENGRLREDVSRLRELAEKLKNALSAYKDVKPDSPEGKLVAEMEDFRKEIMGIYTSALVDAGENFRENGIYINGDGAKYSIREIIGESGKNYGKGVYLDSTIPDKLSDAERINAVKGFIRKIGGSSFTAYDKNGIARDIIIAESRSRFRNSKGKSVQDNNHMTSFLNNHVKQEALVLVDEMITTSVFDGKEKQITLMIGSTITE